MVYRFTFKYNQKGSAYIVSEIARPQRMVASPHIYMYIENGFYMTVITVKYGYANVTLFTVSHS